jgi:hypothetical protein
MQGGIVWSFSKKHLKFAGLRGDQACFKFLQILAERGVQFSLLARTKFL